MKAKANGWLYSFYRLYFQPFGCNTEHPPTKAPRFRHSARMPIQPSWYYTVVLDRTGALRIRGVFRSFPAATRAKGKDQAIVGVLYEPAGGRPLRDGDLAPSSLKVWTLSRSRN